jgi:hypothetical protein
MEGAGAPAAMRHQRGKFFGAFFKKELLAIYHFQ